MKRYVIENTEGKTAASPSVYLSAFKLENNIFPFKSWKWNIDEAIKFNTKDEAKHVIQFLRVNTPDTMVVTEINEEGFIPFKWGDRSLLESNRTAKLYFKSLKGYYPARIICWDRKGIQNDNGKPLPIVALVSHPTQGEILFETTLNGEAWSSQLGQHQALYIKFE